MQPQPHEVTRIIATALAEDLGADVAQGDVTSNATIPADATASMHLVAREPMVLCGVDVAASVFAAVDQTLTYEAHHADGAAIEAGTKIASVEGKARSILTAERTALNLLQRMSGVATETAQYVKAVQGTGATVLDTRKTMPGLRALDKYAVRMGGGQNHRIGLYDAVLIKDNHIAVAGGVAAALADVKNHVPADMLIEIECDTLEQVQQALAAGATRILLDNMTNDQLREAVALCQGKADTEASGNVNLDTIRAIAETGVDYISVGRITHSVRNVDVGLDE